MARLPLLVPCPLHLFAALQSQELNFFFRRPKRAQSQCNGPSEDLISALPCCWLVQFWWWVNSSSPGRQRQTQQLILREIILSSFLELFLLLSVFQTGSSSPEGCTEMPYCIAVYPFGPPFLIIIFIAAVVEVRFARGLVIQNDRESSTFTSATSSSASLTNRTASEVTTTTDDDKKWFCVERNMEAECVHRPLNSH